MVEPSDTQTNQPAFSFRGGNGCLRRRTNASVCYPAESIVLYFAAPKLYEGPQEDRRVTSRGLRERWHFNGG